MAQRRGAKRSLFEDEEVRKGFYVFLILVGILCLPIAWWGYGRIEGGRLERYYTVADRGYMNAGDRMQYAFNIILTPEAADNPALRKRVVDYAFRQVVHLTPSVVYKGYVYRKGMDPTSDPALNIYLYSSDGKDWGNDKAVQPNKVVEVTN